MRIRWRNFELPNRVTIDESTRGETFGCFFAEPFERGFGTTVGNGLRRILLGSLEGTAVTHVKIARVEHEFTAVEGIVEDVTEVILNLKQLLVRLEGERSTTLRLKRRGAGEVLAGEFETTHHASVVNPELKILTLADDRPLDLEVRVRRMGYVPMRGTTIETPLSDLEGWQYVPGFVPDPLFPEQKTVLNPYENQSFWITLFIPKDVPPGVRNLTVRYSVQGGAGSAELKATVDVRPLVIEPRKDFPVIHWWRAEAIYDYYKVEPWSDEWYALTKPYLENLISHGSDVIFVPAVFPRREYVKRPSQMLGVTETAPNQFEFDFTEIRKFIRFFGARPRVAACSNSRIDSSRNLSALAPLR